MQLQFNVYIYSIPMLYLADMVMKTKKASDITLFKSSETQFTSATIITSDFYWWWINRRQGYVESCIFWFLWYDLNLKPIGLYREMAVGLDDIQTELADLDIEVASYF